MKEPTTCSHPIAHSHTCIQRFKTIGLFCRIYSLSYRALLQKRPIILRSLLHVAHLHTCIQRLEPKVHTSPSVPIITLHIWFWLSGLAKEPLITGLFWGNFKRATNYHAAHLVLVIRSTHVAHSLNCQVNFLKNNILFVGLFCKKRHFPVTTWHTGLCVLGIPAWHSKKITIIARSVFITII